MRAAWLTLLVLLAGCAALGQPGTFGKATEATPSPSPSPSPGSSTIGGTADECYREVDKPAPMFYVGVSGPVSANATFSLVPHVVVSGPLNKWDELLLDSFSATLDADTKTVTVSGSIRRYEGNPEADCAYPMIYLAPKAATLSLPIALPAGTYTVRIASESVLSDLPGDVQGDNPSPQATQSLVVN